MLDSASVRQITSESFQLSQRSLGQDVLLPSSFGYSPFSSVHHSSTPNEKRALPDTNGDYYHKVPKLGRLGADIINDGQANVSCLTHNKDAFAHPYVTSHSHITGCHRSSHNLDSCGKHSICDHFDYLEVDAAILGYLVQHGALNDETRKRILDVDGTERKRLLLQSLGLLSYAESDCSTISSTSFGLALLLNALRHTGQHSAANQLDFGRRITPSPSAKSYMGIGKNDTPNLDQRLRGQLSLWIQLSAIKVNPKVCDQFVKCTSPTNPAAIRIPASSASCNSESEKFKCGPILPSFVEHLIADSSPLTPVRYEPFTESLAMWIDQRAHRLSNSVSNQPNTREVPQTKRRRSIGCFAKLRQLCLLRKKRRTRKDPNHSSTISPQKPVSKSPTNEIHASVPPVPSSMEVNGNTSKRDDPRVVTTSAMLALLDTKSSELYDRLADHDSDVHDSMVKYFEQTCGVLVLHSDVRNQVCANADPSAMSSTSLYVAVVATRIDVVNRLSEACQPLQPPDFSAHPPRSNSRLADSLSKVLIGAGVLKYLGVQDICLSCWLDPQEVILATQELGNSSD